jgi:predicted nucleic acid-binding protein
MTPALVLDASAVLRLITYDTMANDWAEQLGQAPLVLAPELMLTEVANALWKLQRGAGLAGIDPQQLLADAADLPLQRLADQVLP